MQFFSVAEMCHFQVHVTRNLSSLPLDIKSFPHLVDAQISSSEMQATVSTFPTDTNGRSWLKSTFASAPSYLSAISTH
ncbi:hypothetical protein CEXT_773071 [Caerostris extrusa]|uniref:Uncharacterized protein n=1 Tax=Caerostris extrusa TaxID=172846 RepID=A0AAV4QTU6_CAEEX|nr:hypothetical protein CEXT_773071 [Caerostris extrusa]